MKCAIIRDAKGSLKVRWRCPLCSHKWDLGQADGDIVCFLAVHHFARKHGMSKTEILLRQPILRGAADEYFGSIMCVRTCPNTGIATS
jgi:hypothetical protein